jgi:3-oxoacyl-[acyl-carrier protein] reductase
MRNYLDLTGRVALVTGASSGIGAATAAVLADLGASVALGYLHNEAGASETSRKIVAEGGKAITVKADVKKPGEVRSMMARVTEEFGPIDILVNNAGSLLKRAAISELTPELWDEVFDVNLKSAVLACQTVLQSMAQRRKGSIINVVSIAGRNGGGPGATAYAAAKGALITFTKGLAKEAAPFGVRVNGISPGVIDTPFHEMFSTPEMIANFVKGIPLGRVGTSMECATVVAFLASDAASYLAGETIEVNGGQLML